MPRRSTVAQLPAEQLDFVIRAILDGDTDREISHAFHTQFKKKLAKSSLSRWRAVAGNELADRYRLARFTANQLLADIKEEDADKYQVVIEDIEDRLLTATREAITTDPIKLLRIRQQEEKFRLKQRELDLKEKQLEAQRQRAEREANLHNDRFRIAAETWQFILLWFTQNNPSVADLLTASSEGLLKDLETSIENPAS
jgi:hypothetical protein